MLKISQLVYFCAVVEEKSIALAALRCHCVAANITIRIKELERLLDAELFYREKNRIFVTPEGRLLYENAKKMIDLHDRTVAIFSADAEKGTLNIGALDAALSNQLPGVIAMCREKMPGVAFNVRTGHSFDLESALLDGSLDIIISDGPVQHPLMTSILAFKESLMLVTSSNVSGISQASFNERELYVFGDNCFYRNQVDNWLTANNLKPRIMMEFESYPVMFSCIKKDLGCAFIPESFRDHIKNAGDFTFHTGLIEETSDLYFIWRKHSRSKLTANFINHVKNYTRR
ncbi:LysR family transcriptional regulator [Erwinia psidii]|uniref:LysR family transcriptional regulator n=1 Tax=Erwinia psidii TaxID=69224 RepID=UPI00226B783C|nr:LysR family transcriptional regulator [Erwinia psidii]MCX8957662.1 LysR family transcriptional regulator [Erwinia psidii]MCX8960716.1 LysR family transcriptional regulator [Erwinia psidii]